MIKNVLILGDEYEEKWNAIATEMRIADCYTTTYKGSDKATGKNYTRVLSLAEDNAIDTVFFGKEYRNIGNKLLWQVKSVQRIIMYGVECPLMIEEDNPEIESKAWDRIAKIAKDDNPIAQTGWRDSFSGELIGDDEIDEFCNNVKVKLLPHINKDRDVLEIGFASGFTCMTLAPYANKYYGIDLSNVTVEKTQKRMSDMGIDNTELVVGDGLHINQVLKDVQVDVVILNSVIQYFPGYNYFLKVIENAISMIKNKGYIFIGDILDYDKKAEFDKLVIERGGKKGGNTRDLWYTKEFIQEIRAYYAAICDIDITEKIGEIQNEFRMFRFDALLQVDKGNITEKKPSKLQYSVTEDGKWWHGNTPIGEIV